MLLIVLIRGRMMDHCVWRTTRSRGVSKGDYWKRETRQADILRPLAPILTARDDTFTIRSYGDARDANGNILARAWCEATVRRVRDFVDSTEAADLTTAPKRPANRTFGRRFEIVSFRWLAPDEV